MPFQPPLIHAGEHWNLRVDKGGCNGLALAVKNQVLFAACARSIPIGSRRNWRACLFVPRQNTGRPTLSLANRRAEMLPLRTKANHRP